MRLYSYIVRFDGGFAPCVTGPFCTLACCKPRIRAKAAYGDWVAGTTPKDRGPGRLIYLMRVERAFTFREYHDDPQFGARIDNIYKPKEHGGYAQESNEFHDSKNIRKDLSTDRVLASQKFVYFGKEARPIAGRFAQFVPTSQGHRVFGNAPGELEERKTKLRIDAFIRWAFSQGSGVRATPFDGPRKHTACS